ncbi:hypothetical protein TNCV_623641 [Trichonephila clavipes]|nr:hypothetical protein TNCV_623641 [Trichonephila clavipes]
MKPPHMNTIVFTSQIESRFVTEDNLVPFRCSPIPSCATPLQVETSLVDVVGNTRDGRRYTRCPSARCLAKFREDTRARSENAACVWTTAKAAVGSKRAGRVM